MLSVAFLIVFVVVTLRLELLPLAVWLMWGSRRTWAWSSALAWTAVLLLVPFWGQIRNPTPQNLGPSHRWRPRPQRAVPAAEGLVYTDDIYNTAPGDVAVCAWGHPWDTTMETGGRIRPLLGLYKETAASAEFIEAATDLRSGAFGASGQTRPHWFNAWQGAGSPSMDNPTRAAALGAAGTPNAMPTATPRSPNSPVTW